MDCEDNRTEIPLSGEKLDSVPPIPPHNPLWYHTPQKYSPKIIRLVDPTTIVFLLPVEANFRIPVAKKF